MEKKTLQTVSAIVREAYAKANKAGSRNLEVSIELMKGVVKMEPALVKARERLRELELKKCANQGAFTRFLAQLGSLPATMLIRSAINSDPKVAMGKCEDRLAKCLDNPAVLRLLAEAADEAGAPFIAVEALTLLNDFHPGNEKNMYLLIRALQRNNQARDALKLFQEIARRHPNNIGVQSQLRAAMALASMEQGRWEEEGTTQERAVAAKDTIAEQIGEGTIHDADQAQTMIDKYLKDLEEKDSIDVRRRLAEAYFVAGKYDESIAELEKVAATLGALDPLLDKNIEKAVLAKYDALLEELRKNPQAYEQPEQQAAELMAQRAAYRLERAEVRVKAYPNDTQLRYDLALLKFEADDVDGAIEQFQQARKSPKLRLEAIGYLGRCFAAKKQYDMAIEQLETALKEMVRMDKEKMETLYFLARTLEDSGNPERAMEYYKELYQAQSNFRDVAERIEHFYQQKKA